MVDKITREKRSKIMAAIHSKDTKPELSLRKALWTRGLRYRIQYGKEKIDIAFPAQKIAVFVDGCFWHGCPLHSHLPKSNEEYWVPKLKKNIERDHAKNERLEAESWKVLRFWTHELGNNEDVVRKIESELKEQGAIR